MAPADSDKLCIRLGATNQTGVKKELEMQSSSVCEAEEGIDRGAAQLPPSSDVQRASKQKGPASISLGDLVALPPELIDHIVSFLPPRDLDAIAATCRYLRDHSRKDLAWYRHVQDSVPGCTVKSPGRCGTYRALYKAHDPNWFLPKYKIWFCDYFLTGKLIIARYDPRRCCIEGYGLVAERQATQFEPWEFDDQVIIHSFEPKVMLHKDLPVLQLDLPTAESLHLPESEGPEQHRFSIETPMLTSGRSRRGTFSNFMLARPVEERPNMTLWPPQTIPARHRVRNASLSNFMAAGHKPQKRSEVSDQTFRIRRWMQMAAGPQAPGVRLAEEVYTYSTLDPALYTPTAEKPYRGIWVGDYAGHGCEFLLLHQPDDEVPFNESSVVQREDETLDEFLARKREERIYRGRIEAIKLTGDPNVPRGEYTFIADDIGKNGFIRVAEEARFKGARIVKSRGHVADQLFRNDRYIDSQLILISPDKLAQFWAGFGHINFFERVRIDDFTSPYDDRARERPALDGSIEV